MKSSKTTKPGNSQTIYRKLSDLKKLPNNPRIIKDDDFKKLVKSINDNPDYFEARPVILSDRTGELIIIAGNQRYEAAKQLKLKEIPTFLISGLTEEREKEIIIRDNVANGSWDFDVIANEWEADGLRDWGVDLPVNFDIIEADDNKTGSFTNNISSKKTAFYIHGFYGIISKEKAEVIIKRIGLVIGEQEENGKKFEFFIDSL
jgi:hypothetical protein